jgi:hypothetical protein
VTGTTNYVSKFTGANTLGNSQIFDDGTSVGIGTTSPNASTKLDVRSNIATDSSFGFSNTQQVASPYGVYIAAPATNNLALYTNSASAIRIDSSQKVGIGVTNPAAKLVVNTNAVIGGNTLATGAGASDLTNTNTVFYGTGGSFKTTSGGASTVGDVTAGRLTLKAAEGIVFADGSKQYGAPRVSSVGDSRTGCPPPGTGADTDLWLHSFSCTKSCTVCVNAQTIILANGRVDFYLVVAGAERVRTIHNGHSSIWETASAQWCGNLAAGSYTASPRCSVGAVCGCGASYGQTQVTIFEKQ